MEQNGMEQKEKEQKGKRINWPHAGRVGVSVMNGVIGDYLDAQGNPLATKMGFYAHRKRISLDHQSLTHYPHPLSGRLLILLHGLTNLETIWNISRESDPVEDNYGTRLHSRYGYTPFFLRYNTGLEIKTNGQSFSQQMSALVDAYPLPIEEIVLIGYSMGGLVVRHALHDASLAHLPWVKRVSQAVYIASPHEGAPLEKFGTIASSVLRQIPRDYVSHWADWIDVRSRGIKDLKHGLLADEFASTHQYPHHSKHTDQDCVHVPESVSSAYGFPPGIRHHFISGSVGKEHQSTLNFLVGDSIVRSPSAIPEGAPEGSPAAHFFGIPHLGLATSEAVYRQLDAWLAVDEHALPGEAHHPVAKPVAKPDTRVKAEHLKGTMHALGAGFDQVVNTVQRVHLSIANEPFTVLEKVPVTRHASLAVKEIHHGIANVVYDALKLGSRLAQQSGAVIADCLSESRPTARDTNEDLKANTSRQV
jgi:pimeloyl-ACP methyl ester carboxylesterase